MEPGNLTPEIPLRLGTRSILEMLERHGPQSGAQHMDRLNEYKVSRSVRQRHWRYCKERRLVYQLTDGRWALSPQGQRALDATRHRHGHIS